MEIRRLHRSDRRDKFSCGKQEVDRFLQNYARQNEQKKISATFVATDEDHILGFVTICPGTITTPDLPPNIASGLPRAGRIPVLLIAMLGVDSRYKGNRVGPKLLRRALEQALLQSHELGCLGLMAHAYPESIWFYEKYGFIELTSETPGDTVPMFLPLGVLEQSLI